MYSPSLLIVDDEPNVIKGIKRCLRKENYKIHTANSAQDGLEQISFNKIDVVLSDQMMPGMDGISFLNKVREIDADIVRVMLTGNSSVDNVISAINRSHIFSYLSKPWSEEVLTGTITRAFEHREIILENKRLLKLTNDQNRQLIDLNSSLEEKVRKRTIQLETALKEGIVMLTKAAEAKDDDTGEHITRIENLTKNICLGLGMSNSESDKISFFSIMHDIGKIHIPDSILKKPGSLNSEEWSIMKMHTVFGEKILGDQLYYKTAREIARSHHERWDGNGYPDGLESEKIPLPARIVTITDVFDALVNERPYKKAWPVSEAVTEIKEQSGKMFDPDILNIFLKSITMD